MKKVILIKYGELTTKKDNRKFFIKILRNNILDKLSDYNIAVTDDYYRMFIEVNEDDILKEWLEFREETLLCQLSDEDYKHSLNFDKFCEKILRNVSKDNKQFVQSQLDKLYDDFMKYLDYWNEKYYRNGFVDGSQLVMGCFEE